MQDTKRVMQLWLESNLEAHDFIAKDYWESMYHLVQEQLLQADVYVYEQNGQILGFAGMVDNYLAGIFVDKKYRSQGIGKRLLAYIKESYSAFSLNVYQKNRRAVDFYLREGLSVIGEGIDEDTGEKDYAMSWNKNK